ncbi:hypothetical protein ACNKHK_11830 [Shigella flexneri]
MLGMDYGLKELNFFPAEANGGTKALQAIASVHPGPFANRLISQRITATTWH